MRQGNKTIGLQDLVEGFLFSLQAEGRAPRTHEYYGKLLRHFLYYAKSQGWPERVDLLDTRRVRQFLSWVGSRSFEYTAGNGSRRFTKSKPSIAWPYYKALRRLFNWSIEEGFLRESPTKGIHFKAPPLPPVQPYDPEELKTNNSSVQFLHAFPRQRAHLPCGRLLVKKNWEHHKEASPEMRVTRITDGEEIPEVYLRETGMSVDKKRQVSQTKPMSICRKIKSRIKSQN